MPEEHVKTILLVEDEAIIALNEQSMLTKYGYHVLTAYHGEAAVEVIRSGASVDLILMDIDLGSGIDGTQAAEQILTLRAVPILFLSSHSERDVVARTERITSYGYVVKNSSITVLDASIKMAFKLHAANLMLQQERDTLRAVMSASPIGLLVVDEALRVVEANPAAEEISGRRLADMTDPRCGDFLGCLNRLNEPRVCGHATGCATCGLYADIHRTLAIGEGMPRKDAEFRLSRTGGTDDIRNAWIRYSTSALRRNKASAVLLTVEDISEDRARQERMRLLSTLAESDHNLIVITDASRRTVWVNEPFARFTGYTLDDMRGENPGEILQGATPDTELKQTMSAAFERGEELQTEVRNFTRDGRPYWIYMDVQPVRNDEGELTHFVSIQHDITTRRETEHDLEEQDARIRSIVNRSNDGIVSMDAAGVIRYANARYCEMVGRQRDKLVGVSTSQVFEQIHPEDAPRLMELIYAAIARNVGEMEYRYRFRNPSGEYIWRYDRTTCFYGDSGKLEQSWVIAQYDGAGDGFLFSPLG